MSIVVPNDLDKKLTAEHICKINKNERKRGRTSTLKKPLGALNQFSLENYLDKSQETAGESKTSEWREVCRVGGQGTGLERHMLMRK